MTFETSVDLDDGYVAELTVEYDLTPPSRGTRDAYGVPMEPDEPARIDITAIYDQFGDTFEPTDLQRHEIERGILEQIEAMQEEDAR